MTREDAVRLASRALGLLFVVSAVSTLTYLSDPLVMLIHHIRQRAALPGQDYLISYYMVSTLSHVIRFLLMSVVGLWLWNCGPGVQAALSAWPDKLQPGQE